MHLFSRSFGGTGRPIVILHGLFGSSRNWATAGRALAAWGAVSALDLRNHGDSPHSDSHTLADMVGDVREWLESLGAERPVLIGHSMGGQVAMALALESPESVAGLVSVDIAPRAYAEDHAAELAALSLDVSRLSSRREVDHAMAAWVADPGVRGFLAMNLERSGDGFRWRLNVEALRRARVTAAVPELRGRYGGPALFLAAGRSAYVTAADHDLIRGLFPAAEIRVIEEADHWVHASAPRAFVAEVSAFLERIKGEGGAPRDAASRRGERTGRDEEARLG
jgi:pimeloyl-ACP methyl ester carboxylesterase